MELILEVKDLHTEFKTEEGVIKAVNGVSFKLGKGAILGIVGESGSGKSVTSLSIIRLIPEPPGKIVSGEIIFQGENLVTKSEEEMRKIRGNRIAMIFQDPMTSLNPVLTIGEQIAETIMVHEGLSKKEALKKAVEMLKKVRIPEPERRLRDYPHQFSGGMRQRVMIAIALSCNPDILIADEPTTALDVTIQAQILNLMKELNKDFGSAIILITHSLGVVAELCSEVLVMYAGEVQELSNVFTIFKNPLHPYTQGLLLSLPRLDIKKRLVPIQGQPPNLAHLPEGCSFFPRCRYRLPECRDNKPKLREITYGHWVRCWWVEKEKEEKLEGCKSTRS